jgi:hypothetical protein
MIRAAVLTALMDDYDSLKPVLPQDGAEVEWVCFTDSKQLAAEAAWQPATCPEVFHVESVGVHPAGWQIVYLERPSGVHPNRAAKAPKVQPALFTDAPASVWLDASFRVVSPRFVVDTVTAARESPSGIAQFRHPWRDDYRDEADASLMLAKYGDQQGAIRRQADAYDHAGMPRHWGLWATGVIAREHRPDVLIWGTNWGMEIHEHSYQDQISHPYSLWRAGLRPVDLPGTHFANPWVQYQGSGRH